MLAGILSFSARHKEFAILRDALNKAFFSVIVVVKGAGHVEFLLHIQDAGQIACLQIGAEVLVVSKGEDVVGQKHVLELVAHHVIQ